MLSSVGHIKSLKTRDQVKTATLDTPVYIQVNHILLNYPDFTTIKLMKQIYITITTLCSIKKQVSINKEYHVLCTLIIS